MASNAVTAFQGLKSYMDLNELYTSKDLKCIVQRQCQYLQENPYGGLYDRTVPIMLVTAGGFSGYQAASKACDQLKNFSLKGEDSSRFKETGCLRHLPSLSYSLP